MQTTDRITGIKLSRTLDQIMKDRIILKIAILGTDYEGLTIVIGIDNKSQDPCFMIDYPGGSEYMVRNAGGKRVFFEFSGKDKVQYCFRSSISKVTKDCVLIRFPEVIERIQRRKHFRIPAPPGTRIIFIIGDNRYEFNVVNISEGGALINQKARFHAKEIFYEGGKLENFYILCDADYLNTRITVEKAEIRRIEKRSETGLYTYALQFLEVGKMERNEIRSFVYDCQRMMIKRRSF